MSYLKYRRLNQYICDYCGKPRLSVKYKRAKKSIYTKCNKKLVQNENQLKLI